ncbi:hypothetical protein FHR88_002331 [Bradyrhizobium betae]|nr:hypothetical protein [Bradyrhizobium betae]
MLIKGFPRRPQPKKAEPMPAQVAAAAPTPTALRPKAPPMPTPEQRAAWEVARKERVEAEAARCAAKRPPPTRPAPPPLPGSPEYQAALERMAAMRGTAGPQPPAAPQPAQDTVGYVDEEETHDEDGRLIIRTPVQPGPRPAAVTLTPEIEARAVPQLPRPAGLLMSGVTPRRPTVPTPPKRRS